MDPRNLIPPFGRGRNPGPDLPRGAVPPGARFDPFNPPGVGPNPNPNPRNPRNPG
jgi:proteasome inhibitor subunit 1 (PI31)